MLPTNLNKQLNANKSLCPMDKNKTKPVVTVAHQASNGINPLDTILNEIEAFDTANKKKIKKEIEIDNDEVDNAPCSSRQLPPTPMPGSYRSLNRTELARQDQDQSMVQSFLDRDDLMQRILAYKMLRGRVESYSTIRIKIDLDSCTIPEYEQFGWQETPDQGGMKRGPMTPPGSPGTNRSSSSGAEAKLTETILPVECSSTMPKVKKEFEDIAPFDDSATKEMLRSFCTISGISTEMIRTFLGDDLQKLDKLKMEDLMKTFLESLKQVAGKKDKECSSKGMRRFNLRLMPINLPFTTQATLMFAQTPQIELNKVVVDNTAFMGTSMSNSQQTNVPKAKVNSKSGKLPSSREVPPVVVDLEFIRNTPPPPIPDIIKRRISNDNKAAGMMSSAVPMVSHRAKRPPQSLLHMDLTRPPVFSRLHPPPPTFRQPNIVVHPSPPPVITTPNASTVLQTVVQAIGGNLRPPLLVQAQKAPTLPRPPLPNPASSPYGKFF
uniref:FH2 domain-containing protein n=1 Tax=Globodera pallida TaxID=36090 RepID=A0A183BNG5_GLOPA